MNKKLLILKEIKQEMKNYQSLKIIGKIRNNFLKGIWKSDYFFINLK